jgi:hypothetical protein
MFKSDNNATIPSSIIIGIVASGVILGIILYLTVKADWSKIIGKWFPWTTFQERTDSSRYNRDDNN